MIFKNQKRILRHHYTIVELLVVLVIAGLLTGMTMSGIRGALARQGAAGAVRTLSTKISLAQSFAVSKNRYVALLMPDYDVLDNDAANLNGNTDGYSLSAYTTFNSRAYSFTKNRLCYVNKNTNGANPVYEFDRWVEGYEWQTLPSKTVAFITEQGADSTPVGVELVPDPTDPGNTNECTALIFKPSGALLNAGSVIVRVFRAAYLPNQHDGNFYWQGAEDKNKGWKIGINGFTGRTKFSLGGEDVFDE